LTAARLAASFGHAACAQTLNTLSKLRRGPTATTSGAGTTGAGIDRQSAGADWTNSALMAGTAPVNYKLTGSPCSATAGKRSTY